MVMSFIETAIEKRKGLRGVLSLSLSQWTPLQLFNRTLNVAKRLIPNRKHGFMLSLAGLIYV